MNEPSSTSFKVRIDELAAVHAGLTTALGELGFSEEQIRAIGAQGVTAECVQCGLRLAGEDLRRLAAADAEPRISDPRLERLKQGYCGRHECPSYFYRLQFAQVPEVDWARVTRRMAGAHGWPPEIPDAGIVLTPDAKAKPRVLLRVGVGLGIILVLLLCKHLLSGGSIPGLHRTPKYQVDPASIGGE